MSSTNTKHKEQGAGRQQPVETIREGAVAASIWKRQTPTGFEYLDFSLSRSWKMKNGEKEGYSQNFFEKNEEALQQVIAKACAYIRLHQPAGSGGGVHENGQSARSAA